VDADGLEEDEPQARRAASGDRRRRRAQGCMGGMVRRLEMRGQRESSQWPHSHPSRRSRDGWGTRATADSSAALRNDKQRALRNDRQTTGNGPTLATMTLSRRWGTQPGFGWGGGGCIQCDIKSII
jgi:hypothetical protein